MKIVLLIFGVLWVCAAALVFVLSQGALHELLAAVAMVVAAVCLAGAGVIDAVDKLGRVVRDQVPPQG